MNLMLLVMHSYGQIQPEAGRVNELFSNPEISWMHLVQLGVQLWTDSARSWKGECKAVASDEVELYSALMQ